MPTVFAYDTFLLFESGTFSFLFFFFSAILSCAMINSRMYHQFNYLNETRPFSAPIGMEKSRIQLTSAWRRGRLGLSHNESLPRSGSLHQSFLLQARGLWASYVEICTTNFDIVGMTSSGPQRYGLKLSTDARAPSLSKSFFHMIPEAVQNHSTCSAWYLFMDSEGIHIIHGRQRDDLKVVRYLKTP
jgi:hypothetical protein